MTVEGMLAGRTRPLLVAAGPFLHARRTVPGAMADVLAALAPAVAAGTWRYGLRCLSLVALAAASALLGELVGRRLRRSLPTPAAAPDGSALVTGVLLACCCPAGVPFWTVAAGALFATLVAKQAGGGLGRNRFNPAQAGRAFVLVAALAAGMGWASLAGDPAPALWWNPFWSPDARHLGVAGACLGEASPLVVVAGGAWLLARGHVSWHVPAATLAAAFGVGLLATGSLAAAASGLLSGGLLLGAFFAAADPVTTPLTRGGRLLFGAGCGALAVAARRFVPSPEGVAVAVLLMNALTPLLDDLTRPRRRAAAPAPLAPRAPSAPPSVALARPATGAAPAIARDAAMVVVLCRGSEARCPTDVRYRGPRGCLAAQLVAGGTRGCAYGCLGLGDCASACPTGALQMGPDGLPRVDRALCTLCEACCAACPRSVLERRSALPRTVVRCRNLGSAEVAAAACDAACRACSACVRACAFGAVRLHGERAEVDPALCRDCGRCVAACPRGCVDDGGVSARRRAYVQQTCAGCATCVAACPAHAISGPAGGRHAVNPVACAGCGACVEKCPTKSIILRDTN